MLQATIKLTATFFLSVIFAVKGIAQANCAGAVTLTPSVNCVTTTGDLQDAVNAAPTGSCGGATSTTTNGVWYKFTATSANASVTVNNLGSNLTAATTYIEVLDGSCPSSFSVVACQNVSSTLNLTTLVAGTTYYIRVYVTSATTGNPSNRRGFNICLQSSPNDNCSSATSLTSGAGCINTVGSLILSTASTGLPTGCEPVGTHYDVWYSFVATNASHTVSISGLGSNFTSPRLQLYSGSCGSLSSVICGTTSLTSTGLTIGNTYYIRVSNVGSSPASNGGFNICVTHPSAPPANDECAGAVTLSSGVTNNAGTVWGATASSSIPTGCITGDPDDDVWYKITPAQNVLTVSLSAIGTELAASGTRLQLFSGSCGTLTSVACGKTKIVSNVTIGATYHIRVYSAGTGSIGGVASGSAFSITATAAAPVKVTGGRMKEVYQQTTLSGANLIADPWEITYGPDGNLWITEAKGYKLYKMDPASGEKVTVLDVSQGSSFFSSPADQAFYAQFNIGTNNPQGGFAGLALHPNFLHPTTPVNYAYVSYVHSYQGGASPTGIFYTNRVVRFTYNPTTERMESPVSLCDTLPGSNDHNSQRMIIAPVAGTYYLFYASGDMGSGQFSNRTRPMRAQDPGSYEGKILRFNLESDGDAGLDAWIPNDNPISSNSAVWCTGIRNNQGFAYDPITGIIYGSSHGPYSDDEINIIEPSRNYGHPLVIGYAADTNYNGSGAGANTTSTCPVITSETANAATIGASYKDALFSAYPTTKANINNIYLTNPPNGGWPSEGWSGMDIYKHTLIPGWNNSLVVSSLKWGRILKLKLGSGGTTILPTAGFDTVSYFGSTNRFRDVAFAPDGKDMFVVMDRSTTSSGPSAANPVVPACAGCVQRYSFLGYADVSGKSSIPTTIDVTAGTANSCTQGTTVTIDDINNNLWVPITGPDGNIMAEIKANGQNLGAITSSFYTNSGALRQRSSVKYLDRNITITPAVQPSSPVAIRLYFSKAEFDALDADPLSGISSINGIRILKNNDACGASFSSSASVITPEYAEAHGTDGYMVQANISGFSSFYFASQNIILPLDLLTFRGSLQNNATLLQWETANETNTSHFVVERSVDGRSFSAIGTVAAAGNSVASINYSYTDDAVTTLASPIIYYRLKMVDADDAFTYSAVITITLADITGKVTVFPNPAERDINVSITAPQAGLAQWKLMDNTGRVLLHSSKQLAKGSNDLRISIDKLPSGVYYFTVSGAGLSDQQLKIRKL